MPPPGNHGEIYRFGAFELAAGAGELRKNGLRLKLQDQPIRLLILLLENAGEVVTRDQIQKRLWADDVHVDYENAINSAVRKLREVLVDTSENPRYVETLAKRGLPLYRPGFDDSDGHRCACRNCRRKSLSRGSGPGSCRFPRWRQWRPSAARRSGFTAGPRPKLLLWQCH